MLDGVSVPQEKDKGFGSSRAHLGSQPHPTPQGRRCWTVDPHRDIDHLLWTKGLFVVTEVTDEGCIKVLYKTQLVM